MTTLTTKNFHDKLLTATSRLKADSKSYNENKWHRKFWNDLINFIDQNDAAMISLVSNSNILEIMTLPMDSSYDQDVVSARQKLFRLLLTKNIVSPLQNGVKSLSKLITFSKALGIENNQQIIDIAFKYFISFNIDDKNIYNQFRCPSIFTYIYRHTVDNKVHEAIHYFGDYGRDTVEDWKTVNLLYENNFILILNLIQRGFEIFSVYKLIKSDVNLIRKCPWYYSSDDNCYYDAHKIEHYINNNQMELNNDFDNFMKSSSLWGNRLCFYLFINKLHFVPLALRQLRSILYGCGTLNDTVIDIILEYHTDTMMNVNEYDDTFIQLSIKQFLLNIGLLKGRLVDGCRAINLMFFIDNILIPMKQKEHKYYEQIVDTIRKLGKFDFFSIEFDFDWDKRYWFHWLELSKHANNFNGKKWKVNVLKAIIQRFVEFGDVYYLNLLFETISKRKRFTRVYKHASALLSYREYCKWMNDNLLENILQNSDIEQQCKDVIKKYNVS